jgi:hypothetical protein
MQVWLQRLNGGQLLNGEKNSGDNNGKSNSKVPGAKARFLRGM